MTISLSQHQIQITGQSQTNCIWSFQHDSYSDLRLYANSILIKYPDQSRKHRFNLTHWEKSLFNVDKSGVGYGGINLWLLLSNFG